ncbi:hypothetical protein Tco_1213826 [Tanacetum coccineum]
MHIQQRGPNKGRRRVADKYKFSREVRTKVDEEQQTNTYTGSAAERSEQRCIAHNYINTEMNESRPDRQHQTTESSRQHQTADRASDLDRQQTDACRHNQPGRQQIDASRQFQPDNIRCRTKQNQTDAEPM